MRLFVLALGMTAGLGAAQAAVAAPSLEISNAVVRVIVSPEPRADVRVEVTRANPHLPLRIWTFLGRTHVDGGLQWRIRGCSGSPAQPSAFVVGLGQVNADAMPQIVVHVPLEAQVSAGGAVFGQAGRSETFDLTNAGCGAWDVGAVRGRLRIMEAGSGAVRAGAAGSGELDAEGSGAITVGNVMGPLTVMNLGSGDVDVAAVNGPVNVRVAGSGHVRIAGGRATTLQVSVAGSGDVTMNGVAGELKASVMGSGDVRVARVTGPVSKTIMGSGAVRIGS
jgi:hypothetical protein